MKDISNIYVIIPAYNEEDAIASVIKEIPKDIVTEIIVVDNGSDDQTREKASKAGAKVLSENEKGYGAACLKGINYVRDQKRKPEIIVFLDGDHSDYPQEMTSLIDPIINEQADMVIGSRALGEKERGSMTVPQIFGNWLATSLLYRLYKQKFTDLGPFRAIRYQALLDLEMKDRNFGWTVEMQIKAAKKGLNCREVPVNYRKRIGKSKVSGTVKGTIMAGYKILYTLFKYI